MVSKEQAQTAMLGFRFSMGAAAWLAPKLVGKIFDIDPKENPALPFVGRLYAARNVALGAATMSAEGQARDRLLQLGAGIDVADGLAAILAGFSGQLSKRAALMAGVTAASAAAIGYLGGRAD